MDWMNGWMDGWIDKWIGWMDGWLDEWMGIYIKIIDEWTSSIINDKEVSYSLFEYISLIILDFTDKFWKIQSGIRASC